MPAAENASTSFARLSPRAARTTLLVALVVAIVSVGITLSPLRSGFADAPDRGPGDLALYNAIIRRIRAGETYYQAANAEHARARLSDPQPVQLAYPTADGLVGEPAASPLGAAAAGIAGDGRRLLLLHPAGARREHLARAWAADC